MGADGHIAIYDWEKVNTFLQAEENWQPRYKCRDFQTKDEANAFAQTYNGNVRSNGSCFVVWYYDQRDKVQAYWPGYVCSWTCNGKHACIVYWGDNIDSYPFEGLEWLKEWADANALLVEDQEVWT